MQISPFSLHISPSRWSRGYGVVLHLLLSAAVCSLPWSGWVVAGLLLVVAGHGVVRSRNSQRHGVRRIDYRDQSWYLTGPNGCVPARLQQATVWRWLVVMNFCSEAGRSCPIVLWPDSLEPETGRRLRATLRHRAVFG